MTKTTTDNLPATVDDLAPRLLIVEDEPVVAMILEELLIDAGIRIAGVAPSLGSALPAG